MDVTSEVLSVLRCPDDGLPVELHDEHLICQACGRKYRILSESFIEMLPSCFPDWGLREHEPAKAEELYREEFFTAFTWERNTGGWGDLIAASPGQRAFYVHQQRQLVNLISLPESALVVDVSGAVGNHSNFMADRVRNVVNCDLHTPSIITAYNRKKKNMVCLRASYLRLPLASGSFDCVICTDTLIRGWNHEVKLLKEIRRLLADGGHAFIDFHNRRPFLRNHNICEYSGEEVGRLLSEAGIDQYSISPFGYVPARLVINEFFYTLLDDFFSLFLSPKRHIVTFTKKDQ